MEREGVGTRSLQRVAAAAVALLVGPVFAGAPALSTVGVLAQAAAEGAVQGNTTAPRVPPRLQLDRLHFVGVADRIPPAESIGMPSLKILAVFRQPSTLNQLLSLGVSFQSSELRRLMDLGLLEQRGVAFQTTALPVLIGEEVESFRQELRDSLPVLAADVIPAFNSLHRALGEVGVTEAFPVIATWIVRERAWQHLLASPTIDLRGVVDGQRRARPDRGWWGILWYIDAAVETPHELLSVRGRDRSVQVCWASGYGPPELLEPGGRALLGRLLDDLDGDDRSIRNPERFADLAPTGLIGEDGRLDRPILAWTPERSGTLAAAADAAARAVANAFAEHAPLKRLSEQLRTESLAAAATIAYFELAPDLLRAMDAVGLNVLLAPSPIEPLVDDGVEANTAGLAGGAARQAISVVVWAGLPEGGVAFRLPW